MTNYNFQKWRSLIDGQEVSAIPDSVVDNFEEILYEDEGNTLGDYYAGDLSGFEREQSIVFEGDFSLNVVGGRDSISSTSGLPNYPGQGDTFSVWEYEVGSVNNTDAGILFGVQFEGSDPDSYYTRVRPNGDRIQLFKIENGNFTELFDKTLHAHLEEWYQYVIDWGTDGSINITINDESGTELGSVSETDNTYTGGGIGFRASFEGETYWDLFEIID